MIIVYKNAKIEALCTDLKKVKSVFGNRVAVELFSLINLMNSAKNLADIKTFKKYKVHTLKCKDGIDRTGQVSCSIPSSAYRLILFPLDSDDLKWNGKEEPKMYTTYEKMQVKEVVDYHE